MQERDVVFWTDAIGRVFDAAPGVSASGERLDEVVRELRPEVERRLREPGSEDLGWLTSALGQPGMTLGVAVFFERLGWLPEALFEPMIRAAVARGDVPGEPAVRPFVAACRTSFGFRRINAVLLDHLERGSRTERRGAARALRCAWPEDGAARDALGEVGERRRRVIVEQFVRSQDTELRRALVDQVDLDPSRYRSDLRPTVVEAARIARTVER